MVGVAMWGEDRLPPGPRRDLVLAIRGFYELAGKPSTRDISREMEKAKAEYGGWLSHDGVHAALSGRGVPRWRNLAALVRTLVAMQTFGEQDSEVAVRQIHAVWLKLDDSRAVPDAPEDPPESELPPQHTEELSEPERQPAQRGSKNLPSWPKVTIRLYDDHNAEVKIAGLSHPVNHHDPRAAAIQLVSERAAQLGRPIRVTAVESDGTSWPLVIHPDGQVEAAGVKAKESRLRRVLGGDR